MEPKDLAQEKYVSLTTFKRDGTPVSTPVWCAGDDGRLLVWTGAATWKVKRIRRDPHVVVAASDARGHARGETADGTAAILDDTARVESLLASKYGVVYRLVRAFNALVRTVRRRPPEQSVTLAITPR
jgi:PPOX class probable F420-dependent enzyme